MLRFIKIREKHLGLLLTWRTLPEVTRYMFTDMEYNLENQYMWFEKISNSSTDLYWLVSYNDKLIGLVSLNGISWMHGHCSWAYYIGDPEYRLIGGMLAPYVYSYGFEKLGLKKIMGEVMEGNENVRKMHLLQGCREVGVYKDHVLKYGKYHDVYLFELIAEDWNQLKHNYSSSVVEFEE